MEAVNARRVRLEDLYRETAATVMAFCLRRGAGDIADDVLNEVYLVAWRRLDDLPDNPLPWLLGTARKVLANQRRSQRRQGELVTSLERVAIPIQADVADHPILAALGALPAADRELLLLVAWDGLTTAEAAQALGCSNVAARVRLHRARRRLTAAFPSDDSHRQSSAQLTRPLNVRPKEIP